MYEMTYKAYHRPSKTTYVRKSGFLDYEIAIEYLKSWNEEDWHYRLVKLEYVPFPEVMYPSIVEPINSEYQNDH